MKFFPLLLVILSFSVKSATTIDKLQKEVTEIKKSVNAINNRISTDPFAYDLKLREIVHKSTQKIIGIEKI
ncbi:MAG: hypothetical protein HRT37_21645 [Alteromonadaceae bacterium]|nr:hypothetical protein [Alteromonadaceae bacterium]